MAMESIQALGIGIVGFALIIGVGAVVLQKFGDSVASCTSGFTYNSSAENCYNSTNSSDTASAAGTAYTNTVYLEGQLGSTGLAGWVPAIIAISVGMLFLGYFLMRGNKRV